MTTPDAVLPPLGDGQWSLDAALVIGGLGELYQLSTFSVGAPDMRTQDAPMPQEDGDRFGVDTRGGRLISLAVYTNAYTEADGLDAADRFENAWSADDVRLEPGAVSILRWRRGPRVTRAYGRARETLCDHSKDWTGNIPITATFKTSEPVFYDDNEQSETVTMVPEEFGGLIGPLTGPIIASGYGLGSRGFRVGGTRPTWVPFVVYGPVINPTVTLVGQWAVTLAVTLGPTDYVLVDPRPWVRDVRRSDGANAAGVLTADSQVMSGMKLAPGLHRATLTGNDPTGTARVSLYWRDCRGSH